MAMSDDAVYAGESIDSDESAKLTPSWERRDELGISIAFLGTIRDFYTYRTRKVFLNMPVEAGASGVVLFTIFAKIFSHIVFMSVLLCLWLCAISYPSFRIGFAQQFVQLYSSFAISFALVPVAHVLGAIVLAWLTHGILVVLVEDVRDFNGTIRVIFYTLGAAQLLNCLPFAGFIVGWIWFLGTGVIGLRTVHGASRWAAIAAMLPATLGFLALCLLEHSLVAPFLR